MNLELQDRDQPNSRILVIDEEVPWPANTGKRLRTLNLLSALAGEFSIELLVHANNASREAVAELERRGIVVHVAPSRVPDKSGVRFPIRIAASLAAGLPYSVYSHYLSEFQDTLQELLRARRYALIHCEWTPYSLYARHMTLPVCVAAHNVEWQIWDRMADAETRVVHRTLYRIQAALMRRFERQTFGHVKHATAVSAEDAKAIQALGCRNVALVPNGVDAEYYSPRITEPEEPRSLVFTGSMDWLANQDAISWFIRDVHPLLRARTDYRLYVVGRNPPAWMTDRTTVPKEISVTGTVDDVRPWIAKAAVYVVPLRAGGGSRLKILEALAMAKPVVSTAVGMEGLDVEPGKDLVVADGAERFADAIVDLLNHEQERSRLGRAGRERIEAVYQWKQIAPAQAALWRRSIGLEPSDSKPVLAGNQGRF